MIWLSWEYIQGHDSEYAYNGSHMTWWCHAMETIPHYWPFVRGIHRSLVVLHTKGQVCEALIFSMVLAWPNCWQTTESPLLLDAIHSYKFEWRNATRYQLNPDSSERTQTSIHFRPLASFEKFLWLLHFHSSIRRKTILYSEKPGLNWYTNITDTTFHGNPNAFLACIHV